MDYLRTNSSVAFLVILAAGIVSLAVPIGGKRFPVEASGIPVAVAAVAALLVYVILYIFFNWTVPRRHHHLPAFLVCFTGAFLFLLAACWIVTDAYRLFAIALTGAFLFLYIAVKVGVPSTVSLLVCCDAVSSDDTLRPNGTVDADREGALKKQMIRHRILRQLGFTATELEDRDFHGPKGPPWVWPYHFEVAKEGTVSWHLRGKEGTIVTILFDLGFDPFSFDKKVPSKFRGVVPGTIIAGPVVRAGRGPYTVKSKAPNEPERVVILGGGGSQDKHS